MEDKKNLPVGFVLKQIRKAKNISQKEIANILALSPSSIYRFEKGGDFNFNKYLEYCSYLKIGSDLPLIICNNDKAALLYERICLSGSEKEMFELMFFVLFIRELNLSMDNYFDSSLIKIDKTGSNDFIRI